jgi:hypothetical protein
MATPAEIRAALDARFGSDFLAEITRLEGELQRLYDGTLGQADQTAQRFRLSQMLASMQELRRLLGQASAQAAAAAAAEAAPTGPSPHPA